MLYFKTDLIKSTNVNITKSPLLNLQVTGVKKKHKFNPCHLSLEFEDIATFWSFNLSLG